jgi:hypothetical protein
MPYIDGYSSGFLHTAQGSYELTPGAVTSFEGSSSVFKITKNRYSYISLNGRMTDSTLQLSYRG